jgi:hypothetical protein
MVRRVTPDRCYRDASPASGRRAAAGQAGTSIKKLAKRSGFLRIRFARLGIPMHQN